MSGPPGCGKSLWQRHFHRYCLY
ncbi:hypothetical protein [Bacillus timonensis]|nr:hypothetical protein [Bacillus timonensis]